MIHEVIKKIADYFRRRIRIRFLRRHRDIAAKSQLSRTMPNN